MNESHKHEWRGAFVSFLYFFSILAAYYVIRPMRDQLAVEIGSQELPWIFSATFLATLFLTPLFSWVVSRWPRSRVMPIVNIFFILCQLLFVVLFNHQNYFSIEAIGFLFFVWSSVFNLFVVSIFWSFMADIWNDEEACRYFPIIAVGGTLGAIIGPILTSTLVGIIGFSLLLAISSALLAVAVACIFYLGRWAHKYGVHCHEPNNEAALGGGMLDGLKQIFSSPFIIAMSIMMLLNDAIGTIAYVLITDYSGAAFPHDVIAQTRFAAHLDLAANTIQIAVQLVVTRWLLVRYGASFVFAFWGVMVTAVCLAMLLLKDPYTVVVGVMPGVAIVQIIGRALSYGMIQPARETLYTLVSRSLRYKGKNAVDTVVWRAGDVISSSMINIFRDFGMCVVGFGVIWAGLAAASGWIGWRLAKRVENGREDGGYV